MFPPRVLRALSNYGQGRITRNQGYAANAWKETESKAVWLELMEHLNIEVTEVTEKFEQINQGDYKYGNNSYAELKGQNIGEYQKNAIEIGEYLTGTSYHRGGHHALRDWLSSNGVDLASCLIRQRGGTKSEQKFSDPDTFNMGFGPVLNGADAWYINRTSTLVYFYRAETLKKFILNEIDNDRLYWMGGRANETTLAVFVANSQVAWQKVDGEWKFVGDKDLEEQVLAYLEGKK